MVDRILVDESREAVKTCEKTWQRVFCLGKKVRWLMKWLNWSNNPIHLSEQEKPQLLTTKLLEKHCGDLSVCIEKEGNLVYRKKMTAHGGHKFGYYHHYYYYYWRFKPKKIQLPRNFYDT